MISLSPALAAACKPQILKQRIIWGAMLWSVVVLYVALFMVLTGDPSGETGDAESLTTIFYGIAVVLAALAFYIPKLMLSEEKIYSYLTADLDEVAGTAQGHLPQLSQLEAAKDLEPLDQRLYLLLCVSFIVLVVCLAVSEAIAILGFVAAFLGQDINIATPFFVVALVLMSYHFPKPMALLESARDIHRRRGGV